MSRLLDLLLVVAVGFVRIRILGLLTLFCVVLVTKSIRSSERNVVGITVTSRLSYILSLSRFAMMH